MALHNGVEYGVGVPRCYLLSVCVASSLDQQSNNVSLFTLVEQISVRRDAPAPTGPVPLEVHAYFELQPGELPLSFEVRFLLVGPNGLETYSDPLRLQATTARLRTKTFGLPPPPVAGLHVLRVECRSDGGPWEREPAGWPIMLVELDPAPSVTH
jgi:hypothetical protein